MDKYSEIEKQRMLELQDNLQADKYPLKKFKYIGERGGRRVDGVQKASGKADYTMDVQLPGMLYMRFYDSPFPHAKILSMDTSKAEALEGVRCILRYDDPELPESEILGKFSGFYGDPAPLPGIAYFEGEPVGVAIAADTEAIAEEALALVKITWEERPFNLDVLEAMKKDSALTNPELYPEGNHWNNGIFDETIQGDVKKGFAEADKVIEFQFNRRGHTWIGPERPCGIFKWNGDCPEVWSKHQRPHNVKRNVSKWFGGIPMNKITMHSLYQGSSFGGWVQMPWNMGGLYCAAVVAKRTARPVKYVFTRREDFYGESMDDGLYYMKVGFKNDGIITAVEGKSVTPNQLWPVFNVVGHLKENTKIPHLYGKIVNIAVNKGPAVPTRCEMIPTSLTVTNVMNRVAGELGMDPVDVSLKNDGCDGHGMDWLLSEMENRGFKPIDSLKECINKGKAAIDWDKKWHLPGQKKLTNGKMHGLGFTWTHEWDDSIGSSEMGLRVERNDGTISILSMGCDNGVDAENTYCIIAADELGMRLEDINYNPQVDTGFFRMTPDSSTNASANGWAIRHAARILKQRILEAAVRPSSMTQRGSYAPAFPNSKPEDLDIAESIIFKKSNPEECMCMSDFVRDSGQSGPLTSSESGGYRSAFTEPLFAHSYQVQIGSYNPHNPRPHFTRQAYFMEVEVDTETGEIDIIKTINVNDVGKVINRMSCEGQQYGGSIMGIGRSLFEEMIYDKATGVMLNGNLIDYKIATMNDIGPMDNILVETGLGYGPYGLVGIGEDAGTVTVGLLAPAVYNAIGVWIDDYPITPDKVLRALGKY